MDKHAQELQLVCRRSGIKFSQLGSGSPVRISELSREAILACFNVDISQDSKEVHPPSLCHRCAKVIRRYEAARQDLRFFEHRGGGCSDRCIEWLPHKRTGCTFCASSHRDSVGRPPKRRKSSAVLPPPATSEPLEFSPLHLKVIQMSCLQLLFLLMKLTWKRLLYVLEPAIEWTSHASSKMTLVKVRHQCQLQLEKNPLLPVSHLQ